jgi:hypothetical protein
MMCGDYQDFVCTSHRNSFFLYFSAQLQTDCSSGQTQNIIAAMTSLTAAQELPQSIVNFFTFDIFLLLLVG